MNNWGNQREVEKTKQSSILSLPEAEQDTAMAQANTASEAYPSVPVGGCSLHICEIAGEWQVWLNTEDADFTGLCLSVGSSRQEAVTDAVRTCEAALEELQKPPQGL